MLFLFVSCGNDKEETPSDETTSSASQEQTETGKGILSSFTATTLDGEEVDQSILKGKITMVNVWATFCTPCINEMPDLQKLHEDYADKDFQIVGIVCDIYEVNGVFDEGGINEAKEIVKDTGVKYTSLLPSDDLKEAKINEVTAVPETFFVDENGNIIGESYVGSRSYDEWASIIDGILATR